MGNMKFLAIVLTVMVSMVSGLKCYIGTTAEDAISTECPSIGGFDRCMKASAGGVTAYSCGLQAACDLGTTGITCCSTNDCNNPSAASGQTFGLAAVATAIAAYFM